MAIRKENIVPHKLSYWYWNVTRSYDIGNTCLGAAYGGPVHFKLTKAEHRRPR